jgi:uncharacterized protein (TIGR03545 family)
MLNRFIRWRYIFTRLVLLAAACLIIWLGFDAAFKLALTNAAELASGAHVDIGRVHTTFIPPSAEIDSVRVADRDEPMTNIFEFERLKFDLRLRPLLEKKFIVDNAELTGLRFGTSRKHSGAKFWSRSSVFSQPQFLRFKTAGKNFIMGETGPAQLRGARSVEIRPDALYSVKLAREIKLRAQADAKKLRSGIARGAFASRAAKLDKSIARAQHLAPAARAKTLRALEPSVLRLTQDLQTAQRAVRDSMSDLNGEAAALPQAREQDAADIMYRMRLPRLDPDSISAALFGPAAAVCLEKALRWYDVAVTYMPEQSDAPLINPEGQIIHFPQKLHYPAFAVSNMTISGEIDPQDGGAPIPLYGSAQGISSSPSVYGAPLKIRMDGEGGGRSFTFAATIDHTSPARRDSIKFSARGFAAKNYAAGSPASLALALRGGTLTSEGSASVSDSGLYGDVLLSVTGARFEASSSGDARARAALAAARLAAAGVNSAAAELKLTGTVNAPQISLSSDIGELLSGALSQAAGPAAEDIRSGLELKITQASAPAQADMEAELDAQSKSLVDLLERSAAPVTAMLATFNAAQK